MTLTELVTKLRELHSDKKRGYPLVNHERTRDRITESRINDIATHVRYIVAAMARDGSNGIDASELTEEAELSLRTYLYQQGKKRGVVDSTAGTFRLLRELAIEEGVVILGRAKPKRVRRGKVVRRLDGCERKYVSVAPTAHVSNNSEYGLRFADWSEDARREYLNEIKPFFTDPLASKRSKKRPASEAYMKTWLNRAERAFGFLIMLGVPKEEVGFQRLLRIQYLTMYYKWLYERRGNRFTMTTKGDLEQWRHLASAYYKLNHVGERLSELIYKETAWEEVKDKNEIVDAVHADDLYTVFYALVADAEHYEANVARKYNREFPEALAASKWHQAAVWGLTLVTWLRQNNIAALTSRNLYKQDDGLWYFRFPRQNMKSKRDFSDHVVDLWVGKQAQDLLYRVLDKAVEVRPVLIERFRAQHPGKPDPTAFFLNSKGRAYTLAGLRGFFASTSVAFLGPKKRVNFHAVRTIVPTWLFVREGLEILPSIQHRLDHAHIATTHKFYLQVEGHFGSLLARAQMDEKAKRAKLQEQLQKLPDQIHAVLTRFHDDFRNTSAS